MAEIPGATDIITFRQTYDYRILHSKVILNPKSKVPNESVKETSPPIVLVRIVGSLESTKEKPELPTFPAGEILQESMKLSAPVIQNNAIVYKLTWDYVIKLDKPEMITPRSLKVV